MKRKARNPQTNVPPNIYQQTKVKQMRNIIYMIQDRVSRNSLHDFYLVQNKFEKRTIWQIQEYVPNIQRTRRWTILPPNCIFHRSKTYMQKTTAQANRGNWGWASILYWREREVYESSQDGKEVAAGINQVEIGQVFPWHG